MIKQISNYTNKAVPFWIIPILIIIDLVLRFNLILAFDFIEWLLYIISLIFLNEFIRILLTTQPDSGQESRSRRILFLCCFAMFLVALLLITIISYGSLFYFGVIPNQGMINYFLLEPHSVFDFLSAKFYFISLVFITLFTGSLLFIFLKKKMFNVYQTLSKKQFIMNVLTLVSSFVILLSCSKNYQQCEIPFSHLIINSFHVAINHKKAQPPTEKETVENFQIPETKHPADFNILLIINESVRRDALEIYGNKHNTCPNISALKKENPNNFYQFEWGRTNSTMTYFSVPLTLNGISPIDKHFKWDAAPFLWDYAKAAGLHTFMISGHCFKWSNWEQCFFKKSEPDYIYTECQYVEDHIQDKSIHHKMGIFDDRIIIQQLIKHLKTMKESKTNFCGILHLYGTHFPYWHLMTTRLTREKSKLANYYNSIYQQDKALGTLIDFLKQESLLEKTVIIHTSDHGEAFGERGYYGHLLNYYEEDVGVPFWFYVPEIIIDRLDKEKIRNLSDNATKSVCNLDILPTIIDILGIDTNFSFLNFLDGCSLLKKIPQREIYVTNYNNKNFKTMRQGYAVISDSLKYIFVYKNGKLFSECYDMINDPGERINIYEKKKKNISLDLSLLLSD